MQAQIAVSQAAREDHIWTQTWQVIDQGLKQWAQSQQAVRAMDEIASKYQLSPEQVRYFLRYTLNYGQAGIDQNKVLLRYPHYDSSAIQQDFMDLVKAGLFTKTGAFYSSTPLGKDILANYWALRNRSFQKLPSSTEYPLAIIVSSLKKVTDQAIGWDDGFPNASIKWRRQSWAGQASGLSLAVQAQELYKDYTAFNNDNAHYRFDRYLAQEMDPVWQGLMLLPLDKEVLASMRNGRTFDMDQCAHHRNWRQSFSACAQSFDRLMQAELIFPEGESFAQSRKGKQLFSQAQKETDLRFYTAWEALSMEEYQRFKKALGELKKLLKP